MKITENKIVRDENLCLAKNSEGDFVTLSREVYKTKIETLGEVARYKQKQERPFWLGKHHGALKGKKSKEKPTKEYISNILIDDVVDLVESYKRNEDVVPEYVKKFKLEKHGKLVKPKRFAEQFEERFGDQEHTYTLVTMLAEGKSVKEIREAGVPAHVTSQDGEELPVITDQELNTIIDRLKPKPEPKHEPEPEPIKGAKK